jgi:hypothetical protein
MFRCLLFAIVAFTGASSYAEPVYQGKPDIFWINSLTNGWQKFFYNSNTIPILLKAVETRYGLGAATIRSNAASLLAEKGDAKILIPLLKNDFDPVVRKLAADGLVFDTGSNVTLALIHALGDKDSKVRAAAAAGLCLAAREQEPSAVPALVKNLADSDPEVRYETAIALSGYTNGVSAIIPALKKALKNPNGEIRKSAAEALKASDPETALQIYGLDAYDLFSEQRGSKWAATVKVVDQDNKPISKAKVWIIYRAPSEVENPDPFQPNHWAIAGLTDSNGIFKASHTDFSIMLDLNAQKDGYSSTGMPYQLYQSGAHRNLAVTLTLEQNRPPGAGK